MTKGIVVPAGGGKHYQDSPGRFFDLKQRLEEAGWDVLGPSPL